MQRSLLAPALACVVLFGPHAAYAEQGQGHTLTIDITATITGRCGLEASGPRSNDGARLDTPTNVSFGFTLDCNLPFRIGVATKNGGLRLNGIDADALDAQGFGVQKPYDVSLQFATDSAGLIDAGSCRSDQLTVSSNDCPFFGAHPGDGFSPGEDITAVNREGNLILTWADEASDRLRFAAGGYADVITVVVGPRL